MTTVEILVAAQELIRDPARWCQYTLAQTQDGAPTNVMSPTAVRWCTQGARYRVSRQGKANFDADYDALVALDMAANRLFSSTSVLVNDNLGHATVMRMFDEAIRAERAKEQG